MGYPHAFKFSFPLILTLAFTSCSSSDGGGGGGNTAPVLRVNTSQSDFMVSEQSDGSIEVLSASSVNLDANGSYDPDGDALSYQWSFNSVPQGSSLTDADISNASASAASFTPDARGEYIIELGASDGRTNSTETLTLQARSWATAVSIESGTGNAKYPSVAMADNGTDAIAVWIQLEQDSTWGVYGNHFNTTSGWGTAQQIANPITEPGAPLVDVDQNGNAVTAWTDSGRIYASEYSVNADSWSTAETRDTGAAATVTNLGVAVADNGNAVITWYHDNSNTADTVHANYYNSQLSSNWNGEEILESGMLDVDQVRVGIDADGNAVVVWQKSVGQGEIHARVSDTQGTWAAGERIDSTEDTSMNIYDLQVAVSDSGNTVAVWNEPVTDPDTGALNRRLYANSYLPGGAGWRSATTIPHSHDRLTNPTLGVDNEGDAVLLWVPLVDSSVTGLNAGLYDFDLDSWGAEEQVATGSYTDAARVAVDGDRDAVVVWYNNTNMQAATFIEQNGWQSAAAIEEGMGDIERSYTSVDLAGNANGNGMAVWLQREGTDSSTAYSVYALFYNGLSRSWGE